ncbi:hypothetical protein Tco_0436231, partial [Tanacetum coccineum]
MEDWDMTMEEYVQYETERALGNAIVYNDALTSELEFSSEPMVSPQHVDELNWKNETSLSEYDDEKYNVINTSIWKTFGGNTRDLDSIWEENGQ